MSYACLKSTKVRKIFTGEPSIIIYNGRVLEKELRKLRFSLADLGEQLRISGCDGIAEVQVAVLETNGQLSIIKKSALRPVTVEDLQLDVPETNLPYLVIMDGEINFSELKRAGKDEKWLSGELAARKIANVQEVFLAELSPEGTLLLQEKEK